MAVAPRVSEAACLAVLVALAAAAPPPAIVTTAGYLTDSDQVETAGWMEVLFGLQLDAGERRCAADGKVLFRPRGECFRLFQRAPCGAREWLVLDRAAAAAGNLTAACRPRPCAPRWGFDSRAGKCFEQDKCPPPTAFQYSLFGDGECRCAGASAGARGAACHELFRPDACPEGMILAPRYRLTEGVDSTCTPDPCFESSTEAPAPAPPVTRAAATDAPEAESDLLVLPKDDSHLGSFLFSWPQPPPPRAADSPWRAPGVGAPGTPAAAPGGGTPGDGFAFPADRRPLAGDAGGVDPDSEVEVFAPEAPAPAFHLRTATRAVLDSGYDFSRNSFERGYGYYPQGSTQWVYFPAYQARRAAPSRRFRRWAAAQRDNRAATPRVDTAARGAGDAEGGGRERVLNVLLVGPPPSTPPPPSSSPPPPPRAPNLLPPAGAGPASVRRGAVNALRLPPGGGAASPLAQRVGGGPVNALAAAPTAANDVRAGSAHARLNVQYPDGSSLCYTPAQLNISCELQMVPLLSELSGVRVPLCIDSSFRFAFGRVGKAEECAEDDRGVCAKAVVVNSPDPFDWDLE